MNTSSTQSSLLSALNPVLQSGLRSAGAFRTLAQNRSPQHLTSHTARASQTSASPHSPPTSPLSRNSLPLSKPLNEWEQALEAFGPHNSPRSSRHNPPSAQGSSPLFPRGSDLSSNPPITITRPQLPPQLPQSSTPSPHSPRHENGPGYSKNSNLKSSNHAHTLQQEPSDQTSEALTLLEQKKYSLFKTAQNFEALLVYQMFKAMEKNLEGDVLLKENHATKIFKDFLTSENSLLAVKNSSGSTGLAKIIYEEHVKYL